MPFLLALSLAVTSCSAVDGDTIRCGEERIRLTGIDAPELSGCFPRNRRCVPGDGKASHSALAEAMRQGPVLILRLGQDRYGRTLAVVYAGTRNLACYQLETGHAFYRRDWDDHQLVAHACPQVAEQSALANRSARD